MHSLGDHIYLEKGTEGGISVDVIKEGKPYVPVEGDIIEFILRREFGDKKILLSITANLPDKAIYFKPEDTKRLPHGDYIYLIRLIPVKGWIEALAGPAYFTIV